MLFLKRSSFNGDESELTCNFQGVYNSKEDALSFVDKKIVAECEEEINNIEASSDGGINKSESIENFIKTRDISLYNDFGCHDFAYGEEIKYTLSKNMMKPGRYSNYIYDLDDKGKNNKFEMYSYYEIIEI